MSVTLTAGWMRVSVRAPTSNSTASRSIGCAPAKRATNPVNSSSTGASGANILPMVAVGSGHGSSSCAAGATTDPQAVDGRVRTTSDQGSRQARSSVTGASCSPKTATARSLRWCECSRAAGRSIGSPRSHALGLGEQLVAPDQMHETRASRTTLPASRTDESSCALRCALERFGGPRRRHRPDADHHARQRRSRRHLSTPGDDQRSRRRGAPASHQSIVSPRAAMSSSIHATPSMLPAGIAHVFHSSRAARVY